MIPVIETFCDLFFGDFPASSVRLLLSLSTKLFSKNAFSVSAKAILTGEEYFLQVSFASGQVVPEMMISFILIHF